MMSTLFTVISFFLYFSKHKQIFLIKRLNKLENNFSTLWSLNEATTYEIQQHATQKIYQIQLFEEPKSLSISSNHLVANYGTKIQIFNTENIRIKDSKLVI